MIGGARGPRRRAQRVAGARAGSEAAVQVRERRGVGADGRGRGGREAEEGRREAAEREVGAVDECELAELDFPEQPRQLLLVQVVPTQRPSIPTVSSQSSPALMRTSAPAHEQREQREYDERRAAAQSDDEDDGCEHRAQATDSQIPAL